MEIKEEAIQKNNKALGIALLVDNYGEEIEEKFHPSLSSVYIVWK